MQISSDNGSCTKQSQITGDSETWNV